jgi:hypothetical protein
MRLLEKLTTTVYAFLNVTLSEGVFLVKRKGGILEEVDMNVCSIWYVIESNY